MAIVKTLIVKGVARFLTDAYMSTIRSGIWNGSTIQVGYGGTGVTSAKGDLYTPVFLSSSGIAPCTVAIPHNTKDFKINGTTYSIFTTYTGTAPTIFAPTTLAGTGGYILATNAAKTGLEWVAANNHTHSLYVLLDSGTTEQTIKSSTGSLGNGVIELWRAVASGYPMIGFANGTTKTHLGKLGFGAEANKPIFRNTSNTDYLLAHAGNIVNDNITVALNTEKTIATIAGVAIKLKVTGTNNVTTSAVVASSASGTTLITAAQANPYYNLLEGGAVTRSIQFTSSNITISSTTAGAISFTAKAWSGATASANGTAGYMPGAAIADRTKFLRGDGSWIALSLTDHTHSVTINGSEKTIAAPGGTAVDLGDYVPKIVGTGSVVAHQTSVLGWKGCKILIPGGFRSWMMAFTVRIYANYNYTDIVFSGYHHGSQHWYSPQARVIGGTLNYKVVMGYEGDSASSLYVWIGNTNNSVLGYGGITIMNLHAGHVNTSDWYTTWTISDVAYADLTNKLYDTTTILPAMSDHTHPLSIATDSGTSQLTLEASKKYKLTAGGNTFIFTMPDVTAQAIELASVEKTLAVSTWTNMAAINGYTGTYAIQISSGNVYASGVFTACGGTDSVIDEIPLHVADKGTNTWRPYARISAGQLQMTTNEATGTSREYTIKILKLI